MSARAVFSKVVASHRSYRHEWRHGVRGPELGCVSRWRSRGLEKALRDLVRDGKLGEKHSSDDLAPPHGLSHPHSSQPFQLWLSPASETPEGSLASAGLSEASGESEALSKATERGLACAGPLKPPETTTKSHKTCQTNKTSWPLRGVQGGCEVKVNGDTGPEGGEPNCASAAPVDQRRTPLPANGGAEPCGCPAVKKKTF